MKYSIITVNYNNRDGLQRTIESVIHQSYRDFEFIIIDGGSTDGSTDVLKKYDKQITYWVSEADCGIYHAMNKGIIQARGEYLNFMNSGDRFFDDQVLERVSEYNLSNDIIVGRDFHYNAQTGHGFATQLPKRVTMLTFYIQTLPHQSTFFKKELFNNCQYDENLRLVSDVKFYIQKICVENCSLELIDEIICRREPDGISNSFNEQRIIEHQNVIKQYLPVGAIKDYQSLSLLDKTTLYRLLSLIESTKSRKWLTLCIKIMNRLFIRS